MASTSVPFDVLAGKDRPRFQLPRLLLRLVPSSVALQLRTRRRGIRTKFVIGTTLKANEVAAAIYRDFLPSALAEGRYTAAPPPHVVGHGLEHLQEALDVQLRGVSAQKVVVSLSPCSS